MKIIYLPLNETSTHQDLDSLKPQPRSDSLKGQVTKKGKTTIRLTYYTVLQTFWQTWSSISAALVSVWVSVNCFLPSTFLE